MTTATTTKTTASRAPKAVRKETTKELTAAQQKSLKVLVDAAIAGINSSETKAREAKEHSVALVTAADASADYKVYAARSMARLSAHPAMVATRGKTAGEPALTKMATLIGRPAQSLETYWKAAKALIAKGWDKRTGAPKADERALVGIPFKDESARVSVSNGKAKAKSTGTKSGTKSTTVSVETIHGQLDAVLESVQKFAGSFGLTEEQAKDLFAKLDTITDVIETATAKSATK